MSKIFTVTTPLYYVNDVPHIGHAYTTIAADVLARWKRLSGQEVYFLTGTDEHGDKIAQAAQTAGKSVMEFVDMNAGHFRELWQVLNISHDDFIRTSEERHKKVVQFVFEEFLKKKEVYLGYYEGWYCVHDEAYFSEADLKDKKCPLCSREVQWLKEESYFFQLSKYQDRLLDFYQSHPDFLSPKQRANEIINFVKSGLKDLSVSRTKVKWGIPVRSNLHHTVYVWFDALQNYISAPGFSEGYTNPKHVFNQRWPADVHFVGKEIFRFHAVIWPAMLMALKMPLPKKVFAHGWWTVEGTKMSKSLGNVVDPHQMVQEFGVDAFRYFLLREVPFGNDGDFSRNSLLMRYNSELANNLGNLLQRTVTLILKNLGGQVPVHSGRPSLLSDVESLVGLVHGAFEKLAFNDVLETLYALMIRTNKYIDEKAPWTLGADQKGTLSEILWECTSVLKLLSVLLSPFMPQKMQSVWERIGQAGTVEKEGRDWLAPLLKGPAPDWTVDIKEGQIVVKGEPLFLRMGRTQ